MHKTKMKGLAKRVLSFSLAAIMTLSSGVSSAATVYASEPGQTPAPIATEYAIAVEQPEHGTITIEPSDMAEAGTSVQATVAPNQGYEVTEFLVTADAGDTVEVSESAENQYSFTMPESNVTVTATLEQTEEGGEGGEEPPVVTEYTITSELSEHILLDAPEKYPGGYEVQVGFTLDEGYGLKELSIETESGTEVEYTNENLIYSFVMPEENVVIKATAEKYAEMNVEFALPEGVIAELDQTHYFVGDTATITIENNSGRAIESVSVGKGQETLEVTKVNDTTYTFIVPDEDVDILITLVANTIQVTVSK